MADSEEWIRHRAYALWEEDGCAHGKDGAHWEQARREYETLSASGKTPETAGASKPLAVEPAPNDPVIDTTPAKPRTRAAAKPAATPAKKRSTKKTSL
jgi:Protein of unknown function (DUF2934)